jgi:hypothetical protein
LSTKGVVTPFEILSAKKRICKELTGLERFMCTTCNCVTRDDMILLLTKCMNLKRMELSIIRKVLSERKL